MAAPTLAYYDCDVVSLSSAHLVDLDRVQGSYWRGQCAPDPAHGLPWTLAAASVWQLTAGACCCEQLQPALWLLKGMKCF